MCAVCVCGVDLAIDLEQKDLSTLDTLDFNLLLLTVLQVNAGQVLELEFLSHVSDTCGESS